MEVIIDIEANALVNPTEIWLICCKDISSGQLHIFRKVTQDETERVRFHEFTKGVTLFIGHNYLGYDYPVMRSLLRFDPQDGSNSALDTLILSKLIDYPRVGHSLESYGIEFNFPKGDNNDPSFFSRWSQELEDYCIRDVEITYQVYLKYLKYLSNPLHKPSITLEHKFQLVVNSLSNNGFKFNVSKAQVLLKGIIAELLTLDQEIEKAFLPKEVLIREFIPRATKFGTISKSSVPRILHERLFEYEIGKTYRHTKLEAFNPSSHKQIISVLNEAGWQPTDKTTTHIETEREFNQSKRKGIDLTDLRAKLEALKKTGWKVNENNLSSLPATAPLAARTLAKRILLESRRRTLTEWLGLVDQDTNRIHGRFYGIGAWTHRMAHQQPNTANIPNEFDTQGNVKLLGKEMRSLWCAPKNRLLIGVDAEGIQLRIFAHLIDDKEFTDALVQGKKSNKTDPHSLNQRILGRVCKSRQAAKRFIYALLLGAGLQKLSAILECTDDETQEALDRLMAKYTGWATLKTQVFPKDAARGYLIGLDRRRIRIPGDTAGNRKHLCMSGYLQSGEAIVMKAATLKWMEDLNNDVDVRRALLRKGSSVKDTRSKGSVTSDEILLVNFVHDEWQTETPNNMELAVRVAEIQCKALEFVGQELKLKCPLAGSYWNDDHNDYTIGTNWYQTH